MRLLHHPVLTCEESQRLEQEYFGLGCETEETAMYRAGRAVATAIEDDFEEIGGFPSLGRVLVLAGKGHNAGDALIAANTLLDRHPELELHVWLVFSPEEFRASLHGPFALLRSRSRILVIEENTDLEALLREGAGLGCIDLCLDGILGMGGSPPLRGTPRRVVRAVNDCPFIRFRASVDIPTGVFTEGDPDAFRADFTYATGIAKTPLVPEAHLSSCGRVRYLDLGFFDHGLDAPADLHILLPSNLWQLASFRPAGTHKRDFGHLLLLAGSDPMPGACLMASSAAVHAGTGLVTTASTPAAVDAGTVVLPEVMWHRTAAPEEGGLGPAVLGELDGLLAEASALLVGPGLGEGDPQGQLVERVVREVNLPLVLDASALRAELPEWLAQRPASFAPVVLTPHPGEWKRLGGEDAEGGGTAALRSFCARTGTVVVRKGARTRIANADRVVWSPFGGPVLARGGTGDLLAGMTGALLAQHPRQPFEAAALAAVWHGTAADRLARREGQAGVRTTQLLDHLSAALGYHA